MASIYKGMDTTQEFEAKEKSGEVGYRNAVGPDAYYISEYMNGVNEASAQKQMDFQKMMSDTAHQREVQDLMKAGLNPMMSLNNGASSPTGAGYSADSSGLAKKLQDEQLKNNVRLQRMSNANQMKINNKSLKVQEKLNKYNADLSYAASIFGAMSSAEAQRYYAEQMAGASEYGAQMSYLASIYNADKMLESNKYGYDSQWRSNNRQQTLDWQKALLNSKTSKYQAMLGLLGSLGSGALNWFGNSSVGTNLANPLKGLLKFLG